VLSVACSGEAVPVTQQWRRAEAAWRHKDLDAYAAWRAIDPTTTEGREARRRLEEADARYREGVVRLESGEEGAREALAEGVAIAPMNPELYLRLARACREQDLTLRAAEYYSKFLAALPESDEAPQARAELRALDPELVVAAELPERTQGPWVPALVGLLLGVALTTSSIAVTRWLRGRGISLARLVQDSPEFHPAVAYLVGSLRHELLKHRIGAAADALSASGDQGAPGSERLSFLHGRLYGGQPLREAWEGHLVAFEQALGHRVDLRRDRWFRRAARAVQAIASLETGLRRGQPRALEKLRRAHQQLMELDRHLADLVSGLVRTPVDEMLLHEVVDEVRAEHSAGQVDLEEVAIRGPEEAIVLEVFRVDLVLILKNVVRNAILAVGRGEPPRRVSVDVAIDLEPTGEETVRIRVQDTSAETLDPAVLFDRRVDRGLGLVAAAVRRYGGSIDVEPGEDGFEKGVVVSFFRALEDGEDALAA